MSPPYEYPLVHFSPQRQLVYPYATETDRTLAYNALSCSNNTFGSLPTQNDLGGFFEQYPQPYCRNASPYESYSDWSTNSSDVLAVHSAFAHFCYAPLERNGIVALNITYR